MLGTLFVAGVGALAFKLGMDAKEMRDEGYSTGDILTSIPGKAKDTLVCTYTRCKDTVCGWFSHEEEEDEEEEPDKPAKTAKKAKKKSSSSKSSKKKVVKVIKPSTQKQDTSSGQKKA